MKPTGKERRDLDRWLAVHVMNWIDDVDSSGHYYDGETAIDYHNWTPTIQRDQAMEVLEKCAEKCRSPILIDKIKSQWVVWQHGYSLYKEDRAADTLALGICLFAEQLFSK